MTCCPVIRDGKPYCATHCSGPACWNLPFGPCCGGCTPAYLINKAAS